MNTAIKVWRIQTYMVSYYYTPIRLCQKYIFKVSAFGFKASILNVNFEGKQNILTSDKNRKILLFLSINKFTVYKL